MYEPYQDSIRNTKNTRNSLIGCSIVGGIVAAAIAVVLYFVLSSVYAKNIDEVVAAVKVNAPMGEAGDGIRTRVDQLAALAEEDRLSTSEIGMLKTTFETLNSDGNFTSLDARELDSKISIILAAHALEPVYEYNGRRVPIPQPSSVQPPNVPVYRYQPPPPAKPAAPANVSRPAPRKAAQPASAPKPVQPKPRRVYKSG